MPVPVNTVAGKLLEMYAKTPLNSPNPPAADAVTPQGPDDAQPILLGGPQGPVNAPPPVASEQPFEGAKFNLPQRRSALGNIWNKIRTDPRASMFLLTAGQNMMSPQYSGESGVGHVLNSFVQGMNGVALVNQIQSMREQAAREEARKQSESDAKVLKDRAEAANFSDQPGSRAAAREIDAFNADTQRMTAQGNIRHNAAMEQLEATKLENLKNELAQRTKIWNDNLIDRNQNKRFELENQAMMRKYLIGQLNMHRLEIERKLPEGSFEKEAARQAITEANTKVYNIMRSMGGMQLTPEKIEELTNKSIRENYAVLVAGNPNAKSWDEISGGKGKDNGWKPGPLDEATATRFGLQIYDDPTGQRPPLYRGPDNKLYPISKGSVQ